MELTENSFTTIRILRSTKEKIDSLASKNESYDNFLDKVLSESLSVRSVEKIILGELKSRKYVDFDDIEW